MPRRVTTAEATEGLGVAGFSCPGDAAAPKIITNGCGKEQREVADPTLGGQVKEHGDWITPVFPDWDPGGAVAVTGK